MLKKKLTELLVDFDESKKEKFKEIFNTAVDDAAVALVKEHISEAMDDKFDTVLQDRIEQAVKKKLKAELQKKARKLLFRTAAIGAVCVFGCIAITNMAAKSHGLKQKED